jgi:hypothetical protein
VVYEGEKYFIVSHGAILMLEREQELWGGSLNSKSVSKNLWKPE